MNTPDFSFITQYKPGDINMIATSMLIGIVLAALAMMMFSIIGAKMQGKVPRVFGYSVVNIISGSMEDTIPEGSYILVKATSPEKIKKDDIICFYSSDPTISGLPNTHRVVADPIVTDAGIEFVTKGDANNAEDKYTAKGENLVGRYVKTMNALGGFVSMLDGGGMNVLLFCLEGLVLALALGNFLSARKRAIAENAEDGNKGEQALSQKEIEKMMNENPELVKEIEAKLGLLYKPSESDNENTEE